MTSNRWAVLAVSVALTLVAPSVAGAQADPRPLEPRVVGGKIVDQATFDAQWGFAVGLRIPVGGRAFRCGGSLVTDEVVLTAAHCLFDGSRLAPPGGITVTGGAPNLALARFTGGVRELVVHPGYDPAAGPVGGDDVALLHLTAPVPAPSVALANTGEVPQGDVGFVAGWGVHDQASGSIDNLLRQAALPVHTAEYCNAGTELEAGYGPGAVDGSTQVCAGRFTAEMGGAADTCQGDSGGPLVVRDRAGTRVAGITSYGSTCGTYPAVYTAVGAYRSFLDPLIAAWDPVAPPPPAPPSEGTFVAVVPARIVDTRAGNGDGVEPGQPLEVALLGAGGVPTGGVSAVSLNVTAVEPDGDGYLTVYPCGQAAPLASNLNYLDGEIVANSVVVSVGDAGRVCIATYASTDVVIDVGGYWLASGAGMGASRYHPMAPERLIDTRPQAQGLRADEVLAIDLSGVSTELIGAVTTNITVVQPLDAGYLTAFPCGTAPPNASNANYVEGEVVANAVTVALDTDEKLCVTSSEATDLVVDITGWFGVSGASAGARVVPVRPGRLLDTRLGVTPTAGSVITVAAAGRFGVPAGAAGVVVNLTAVDPGAPGYLSAFPCGQPVPATSTVNHLAGGDRPNLAFVPLSQDGTVCVFTYATSDVVLDVMGYVTT